MYQIGAFARISPYSNFVPELPAQREDNDEVGKVVPEGHTNSLIELEGEAPTPLAALSGTGGSPPPVTIPNQFYLLGRIGAGNKIYLFPHSLSLHMLGEVLRELEVYPTTNIIVLVNAHGPQNVTHFVARLWWGKIGEHFHFGHDSLPRLIAECLPEVARRHAAALPPVAGAA